MKIAVVTGANGQLGRSFINTLAKNGIYSYALDLDTTGIEETENVRPVELDVTDESAVEEFYLELGRIDILINNAGIGVFTPFEQRTADEFRRVMDVNLLGPFLMSKGAVKLMKEQRKGKIVHIGSIYGQVSSDERIYGDSGRNNSEVYSATKAGVIQMTKYMATHFGRYNIQTNCISPGGIFNNQTRKFVDNYVYKTPMNRMGSADDLQGTLLYLISDDSSYTNGQNISVDGGFVAW
jgi:3-oxoacyl-[acyl-carrier protein] reductase